MTHDRLMQNVEFRKRVRFNHHIMTKPKILLCREIPSSKLDDAEQRGKLSIIRRSKDQGKNPAPRSWIADHLSEADAIVLTLTEKVRFRNLFEVCYLNILPQIDAELIGAAKNLKVLSTMSVGTDHIDVDAASKREIKLGTTPDVLDDAVAELTLLLTLSAMRCIPFASKVVRDGHWSRNPWSPTGFCGPALRGKTIGFVGFGNIAQSTASLLPAFGPHRILFTTSTPKPFNIQSPAFSRLREKDFPTDKILVENEPDLSVLASASDVVIVLTTLNASTKHLIGKNFFQKMKRNAVIINTSRGGVIDTDALVQAVEEDKIAGAGLDVLEGEPGKQE